MKRAAKITQEKLDKEMNLRIAAEQKAAKEKDEEKDQAARIERAREAYASFVYKKVGVGNMRQAFETCKSPWRVPTFSEDASTIANREGDYIRSGLDACGGNGLCQAKFSVQQKRRQVDPYWQDPRDGSVSAEIFDIWVAQAEDKEKYIVCVKDR